MSRLLVALAFVLVIAEPGWSQDKGQSKEPAKKKGRQRPAIESFTDPEKAGPDFRTQGEYRGEGGRIGKVGAQIVAEGDSNFTVRLLKGGLPGDGWDGKSQYRLKARLDNGQAAFSGEGYDGKLGGGKLTVSREGETVTLDRVERRSPTLGAKPPEGAVVLFDGSSADAWEKGRLVEGNLLRWGTTSKQKFQDCSLHLEFRTPFMPRAAGQARGNSGVYLQGRYEVQVLDTFGLAGKDNECGGIYQVAAPKVNMCYPPLTWQTYDVDFTAAKFGPDGKKTAEAVITVKHNDVVIHDRVKLPGLTGGSSLPDDGTPGPIHLQDHGNPVAFRNIWAVVKK
jgi:hypothetical protein